MAAAEHISLSLTGFQRKQSHQLLGQMTLKERRLQQTLHFPNAGGNAQNADERQLEKLLEKQVREEKKRDKRQWEKAMDKVAREVLDTVLGASQCLDPEGAEDEPEGLVFEALRETAEAIERERRAKLAKQARQTTQQALKMVQKKMIRSVTQRCVTEIIQESTDAIYKFEDDAISLADQVLRNLLQREIRSEL